MKQLTPVTDLRTLRLRYAEADDVAAIARLWHDGWGDGHRGHVPVELVAHRTADEFERRARSRVALTTVAIVERETAVAGFVVVDGCEVEQLYVEARWRGSGLAAWLLSAAEQQIEAAGDDSAWLAVAPGNDRARRFYERCGWVDDGAFDNIAEISDSATMRVPCRRYVKQLQEVRP